MQAEHAIFSPKSGRRSAAKGAERTEASAQNDAQAGAVERVWCDMATLTRPEEDHRRRTILIEKLHGSFGFTIQSYGIQYRRGSEVEIITYIDHVEGTGPAARAGMREGDVILSINGQDVEQLDHQELVSFIKQCPDRLRMAVLFEDCVRKVSLHMRYIQLQRQLTDRMYALEQLCEQEKHFIASLRSQGRRVPAFYPAQVGYSCRTRLPQPPHGPPPSYAEAVGRLCYHRATSVSHRAAEPAQWRGRGKSWDDLAAGAEASWRAEARVSKERRVLLESGFPALRRAPAKTAKSAESLLGPGSELDTSCFSCDCLRTFPADTSGRTFTKPKSVENLLLVARGGADSLRREKAKEKRRSSLKLCRKGSRSALVPPEDVSDRSERT